MEKYILIYLMSILFIFSSCYEDKGNYSYGEINEMSVHFSPASTGSDPDEYILSQPSGDTLYYELTPVVEQTGQKDKATLEYRWHLLKGKVNNKEIFDTVYRKSYVFKFAPEVSTQYEVLFVVKDQSSGLECYRRLKLRTIKPFMNSWLILHGKEGDRKIAALEYDSTRMKVSRRVDDIYYELKKERAYRNTFAMSFVSEFLRGKPDQGERLFLVDRDNSYWIYPFSCEEQSSTPDMMPDGWSGHIKACMSAHTTTYVGIIDEEGRYFHCGGYGFFHTSNYKKEVTEARIDRAYINKDGYVTLWDDRNKKLMHYKLLIYLYEWRENVRAPESTFNQMEIGCFPDSTMFGLNRPEEELLWLGHSITNSLNGTSAIFYNTVEKDYHLLHIEYEKYIAGSEPVFITAVPYELKNIDFDKNSQFAVTPAFANQIFYSLGNNLYLYNIVNGYSSFVYSVGEGNKITKISFRMENEGVMPGDDDLLKMLGIAVETTNGEGEFHELFFDESGDVINHEIYRKFGPIMDFCYTWIGHN